jgi:hypothetical protein
VHGEEESDAEGHSYRGGQAGEPGGRSLGRHTGGRQFERPS